jgi:catechol 2,3-dioxygenase-like lactoylglutathione lyase family enzyme
VVIDLDHVAIATRDVTQTLRTLVGELGTPVLFGGANIGFRAMQVDGGDLRIELLEPHNTDANDFLERFLEANGEGPHHLTFKTDDIQGLLERVSEAGYSPVGVNIDNPFWKEAFIHPREAGGTVVQIAQSDFDPLDFEAEVREYGPGRWWPDPPEPAATRAILRRVVVGTEEIGRSLGLYRDLLLAETSDHGEGWVELTWPGNRRIVLELAAGRREGIDRLEWTHDGPRTERTVACTTFVLYSVSS